VGNQFRYLKSDVPKVVEAMNADLQPEFREIDPVDAAWLAGFFDGEGHVGIHISRDPKGMNGKQYTAHCEWANTDQEMIEKSSSILSVLGVHHRVTAREKTSTRKKVWRIQISNAREIAMTCRALSSYVTGSRKRKVVLLFEWSMKHIALGHHRGGKYELAVEYAKKIKEAN
jgi:hypothetical protein